jgi:hypothetical protein
MISSLELSVVIFLTGFGMPAAVYLWSKDPERRRRAWQLLRLLKRLCQVQRTRGVRGRHI